MSSLPIVKFLKVSARCLGGDGGDEGDEGDGEDGEDGEDGGDGEVNSKLYLTCSLFPVPCSLFPVPCSLFPNK
ncbi:hypothetical protein [Coleofasciculus sp. E1-EBD-02]|uniref:hypothetical protein n=1 Tax=Coleofasciculus sp. E1-EBD-02 TaxID=3068481 RepID=UPI0032F9EAF3